MSQDGQDEWSQVDDYLNGLLVPRDFAWAVKLARRGALIIVDNVVRRGAALAAEPKVTATAIQTVGDKGHDGLAIALVTG
jgi:predicted O-methyltransferase YrrM